MKIHTRFRFLLWLLPVACVAFSACKKGSDDSGQQVEGIEYTSSGTMTLAVSNMFGAKALAYSSPYVTDAHDTIRFNKLSYYLTNVTLENASGARVNLGNYNLIDETRPATKTISLKNIPAGTYKKISFDIGVDSTRNHTGAQEGDLDPSWGMIWTWNTGYVFFRVKGDYSVDRKGFAYDIGGDKNIMRVEKDLSGFSVSKNSVNVALSFDVALFFAKPNQVNLRSDINDIHDPNEATLLPRVTANIRSAFAITAVN